MLLNQSCGVAAAAGTLLEHLPLVVVAHVWLLIFLTVTLEHPRLLLSVLAVLLILLVETQVSDRLSLLTAAVAALTALVVLVVELCLPVARLRPLGVLFLTITTTLATAVALAEVRQVARLLGAALVVALMEAAPYGAALVAVTSLALPCSGAMAVPMAKTVSLPVVAAVKAQHPALVARFDCRGCYDPSSR
jgi:hypothetical protein